MKVIAGILALAVLCAGAYVATVLTSGQTNRTKDVPTPVKLGEITEKQRHYSREYKKLYQGFAGRKLRDIAIRAKTYSKGGEAAVSIGIPSVPTIGDPKTPDEILSGIACQADAIVRGTVESKTSFPTEDETFVYTEYDFFVSDYLKDVSAPLKTNTRIQVTRPGGLIKLDEQVIRVEDQSYKTLNLGEEYILFLKYVPGAQGYVVVSPDGDFRLIGNSTEGLSPRGVTKGFEKVDSNRLYELIRNQVAGSCQGHASGGEPSDQ